MKTLFIALEVCESNSYRSMVWQVIVSTAKKSEGLFVPKNWELIFILASLLQFAYVGIKFDYAN